ncbi:MAG TPA: ATP-binding protein [Gemmatimonadaceae bacterium]|nr:ATP-binding protein [Gemmatimonadaceae bacterium]
MLVVSWHLHVASIDPIVISTGVLAAGLAGAWWWRYRARRARTRGGATVADRQEVALREELAMLERYLDPVQARFQGRLDVETAIDTRALDVLVPRLILQPLVENAIAHGIERRGSGQILIAATVDGDVLTLRVRDDGPGLMLESSGRARTGGGTRDTIARLERLYGSAARFTLRDTDGSGAEAVVRVPVRKEGVIRVHE